MSSSKLSTQARWAAGLVIAALAIFALAIAGPELATLVDDSPIAAIKWQRAVMP